MAEEKKDNAQNPNPEEEVEVIEGEVVEEGAPPSDTTSGEAVSEVEYQQLAEELERAQTQARDYFEGWQRERADFANYKRRVERDQQLTTYQITGDIVKKHLSILDDLERALKARPTEGADGTWANGIELIYRKLQNIMESVGVQRIPAETEEFDPNRHEAISYEESPDFESGQIIEVVQQGYMLGERVLRPAMVRVSRG